MYEISQRFLFDSPHSLKREIAEERESSLRIHGHSYRGEVVIRGEPDPASGMIIDIGHLERRLAAVRGQLHATLLDDVPGLGPSTIENLSRWIWNQLAEDFPGLHCVGVFRDSAGNGCRYYGPDPLDKEEAALLGWLVNFGPVRRHRWFGFALPRKTRRIVPGLVLRRLVAQTDGFLAITEDGRRRWKAERRL